MLLTVPAHTLPPMRMLCMPFILSLIGKPPKSDVNEQSSSTIMNGNNEDSDSEDDNKQSIPIINNKEKSNIDKDVKEEPKDLINFNWNFLSTILPSNDSTS